MRKIIFFLVLLGCSLQVFAKPLDLEIKLANIKAIQVQEKGGDEVYFSITQYSNTNLPQEGRVPIFPTYWLSKYLDEVKDVTLWKTMLAEGEAVQIVLSLIEHDVPPWNPDDHLGSAKVTIRNEQGQMKAEWSQPNYRDQPKTTQAQNTPQYTYVSKGAEYQVEFYIQQN